jgi:hypothetical protein
MDSLENLALGSQPVSALPSFVREELEKRMRVPDLALKSVAFVGRSDLTRFVPYGTGFILVRARWLGLLLSGHVSACPRPYPRAR